MKYFKSLFVPVLVALGLVSILGLNHHMSQEEKLSKAKKRIERIITELETTDQRKIEPEIRTQMAEHMIPDALIDVENGHE